MLHILCTLGESTKILCFKSNMASSALMVATGYRNLKGTLGHKYELRFLLTGGKNSSSYSWPIGMLPTAKSLLKKGQVANLPSF